MLTWYKMSSNPLLVTNFPQSLKKCIKTWKSPTSIMKSLNSSGLFQITLKYFCAAPTSTVICAYFMYETLERCIDLSIASHAVLNYVIRPVMGGKNVSTVWKVSILNNSITWPTKFWIICFCPEHIIRSKQPIFAKNVRLVFHFEYPHHKKFLEEEFLD